MKKFATLLTAAGLVTLLGQGCISFTKEQPEPETLPTPSPGALTPVEEMTKPAGDTKTVETDDLDASLNETFVESIDTDISELQQEADQLQ